MQGERRRMRVGAALVLCASLVGAGGARAKGEGDSEFSESGFSKQAVEYVARQLDAEQQRIQARPDTRELEAWKLGAEHDAVEAGPQRGARLAPNVGRLAPISAKIPAVERDPAISLATEAALRERLGREPRADELDQAVAEQDARVAALNASLDEALDSLRSAREKSGRIDAALAPLVRAHLAAGAEPSAPHGHELLDAKARLEAEWPVIRELIELEAARR